MRKKSERTALVILFLINLFVLLWSVFGYGIYYEVNDDAAMQAILTGAYGESSPFIVYGNIIYGYMLSLLYQIPGNQWNWMVVIHYLMMFVGFNAIGYVLVRKKGSRKGSLLFYSFLLVFCYGSYLQYTFTRVSGFTIAAGYLLLFYAFDVEGKECLYTAICGTILTVYGSFCRFQPFLMISAFFAGIWFYRGILTWKDQAERKNFLKRSLPLFIMGALVFGSQFLSNGIYRSIPEWKAYLEYNTLRSELLDFGLPAYEKYEEAYQQLGISENDYHCLSNWDFGDPEIFSTEVLRQILDLKKQEPITAQRIAKAAWGVLIWFKDYLGIFVVLLIGWKLVFCKDRWLLLWLILVSAGEIFYLYYRGRALERVTWIVYVGAAIFLLNLSDQKKDGQSWHRIQETGVAILLICAAVLSPLRPTDFFRKSDYTDDQVTLDKIRELSANGNLYIWDIRAYSEFLDSYSAVSVIDRGIGVNSVHLGGWLVESPIQNQILKDYGINNSFEALLMDPDVFLVGDAYIGNKWIYLREHFKETANFSIYEEAGEIKILAFAYNFEDVVEGTADFQIQKVGIVEEKECFILWGSTDCTEIDHLYVQMEIPVVEQKFTFPTVPIKEEGQTEFCLTVPRYNMAFVSDITARLIIERDGKLEYSGQSQTFSMDP